MNRRFPHILAAAVAVVALGASPALAAAQKKHPKPPAPPSAYDVYTQQVPTAKGPKPVGGAGNGGNGGQSGQIVQPIKLSSTAATNLRRSGGKDKNVLKTIATSPALGAEKVVASGTTPLTVASTSTFDLGLGPIALFAALLAVAGLLLAGKLRGRRN